MSEPTPGFNPELSSDVREMRDWVHEFAASVIRPAAAEWDEGEQTPWPTLQEGAKIGEWSRRRCADASDIKLAAFCSSEPDAGSDVAAIRTRAVYDEASDEWVINGVKTWATNGGIANVHVVRASRAPG